LWAIFRDYSGYILTAPASYGYLKHAKNSLKGVQSTLLQINAFQNPTTDVYPAVELLNVTNRKNGQSRYEKSSKHKIWRNFSYSNKILVVAGASGGIGQVKN
jgi:hypothetical protein